MAGCRLHLTREILSCTYLAHHELENDFVLNEIVIIIIITTYYFYHLLSLLAGCRLHLRKCQCREKTPPCRNCPMCKENSDIMALNDPNLQFQLCQVRFKCDICACR